MTARYKAVLFAPDGEWVTDYRGRPTVADVWEAVANAGSRWYFYPIPAVIRDRGSSTTRQFIVAAPDGAEWMVGHSVSVVRRTLRDNPALAVALIFG